MSKITLNNLVDLTNETSAVNTINNNSAIIQTAFDNTLSLSGSAPNQMAASFDMNGNQILNLPSPSTPLSPVRLTDLDTSLVPTPAIISGSNVYTGNNSFTKPIASIAGGFRANLGGTNLVYTPTNPNNYRLFTAGTAVFNINSYYANNRFTPPTGASLVSLNAGIFIDSASTFSGNFECKWIKNFTVDGSNFIIPGDGADVVAGQGSEIANTAGTYFVSCNVFDKCFAGDYYGLFLYVDAFPLGSTTVTIDGNPAHTYISGAVLF